MKSSELRLGNIVQLRATGEIVRVCGLTSRKIRYHKGNDRSTNLSAKKYCEIEGVLIFDHWRKIDCPDLSWDDRLDGEWYVYRPFVIGIQIRFIHELQNLHYALTGEELKVEL